MAQACLQSMTEISRPVTSASSCMTKGDFCDMPPIPVRRSIATPFAARWSRIAFVANAVASANA